MDWVALSQKLWPRTDHDHRRRHNLRERLVPARQRCTGGRGKLVGANR
jgi:hypothetical protein